MFSKQTYREGAVRAIVRQLQAQGKYAFSSKELQKGSDLSAAAVSAQLRRLFPEVVQVEKRQLFYLIVPPERTPWGAPPAEWWLDAYMAYRGRPYYIGLLSAAAIHGASHQAVQETQIITDRPMRPLAPGLLRVRFFTKKNCAGTPVFQPRGTHSLLRVSTAEATALDLLRYSHQIGGIARCFHVIEELLPAMSVYGLKEALLNETETPVVQRLGWMLERLGVTKLAGETGRHLQALRYRPVLLDPRQPRSAAGAIAAVPDSRWKITQNIILEGNA